MKKILITLLLGLPLMLSAQSAQKYYCELIAHISGGYDSYCIVMIGDGVDHGWYNGDDFEKDYILLNEDGGPVHSIVEGANFLSGLGWSVVSTWAEMIAGTEHWVLSKPASSWDEAYKGIKRGWKRPRYVEYEETIEIETIAE